MMKLINNNIIPYMAITIMGLIIYILWEANLTKDKEIANAKAETELINKNMGTIQAYNESKFVELERLKKDAWKEGRHETTLNINH